MTDISKIRSKRDKYLFETRLNWLEARRGLLSATDVSDTIRVATPKSFGGQGSEWSPEHLFLAAISSCYMTTFLALAAKVDLNISHYECEAIGMIEMVNRKFRFTRVDLYPKISITFETDRQKAESVLEKAQRYCLVSSSIDCGIIYHSEILVDRHPLHQIIPKAS